MSTETIIIGKRLPLLGELKKINPTTVYDGIMDVIFREEQTEMTSAVLPKGIGTVLEKNFLSSAVRNFLEDMATNAARLFRRNELA
ncbi:MAG: hypothetical protein Q4G08_11080 [Capnocytophaga sp.]|nr:hypothetical protein [Capnocytophaga sp.]